MIRGAPDGVPRSRKDTDLVAHPAHAFTATSSLSELLLLAASRDRQAFRALYESIGPRIKGFVLSRCRDTGLAEEITQDVLITVWRRADRYDPARAKAETWIFTIARNRVIDCLRHRKVVEADKRDPHFVPDPPPDPDAVVEASRRAERIGAAIETLPDAQREVLVAAFYDSRSYPEIAESQGVALGTVKSRARLAFQRLRTLLAGEDV